MADAMDKTEVARQQREQDRVRDLEGKVGARSTTDVGEAKVRKLADQMAEREVQQRDAMENMRGQGAVHRDGRVIPDVPDHLNNPDATAEDHLKDLERRANTADAVDEDLNRAARGVADAAADGAESAGDPGKAADESDALHGPSADPMPTDPQNDRLDPQPAVEPATAPKVGKNPETAFGAPKPADAAKQARAAQDKDDKAKK